MAPTKTKTKTKTKPHNLYSNFIFFDDYENSLLVVDCTEYIIKDNTLEYLFNLIDKIKDKTNLSPNSSNSASLRKFNSSEFNALNKAIQANSNDEDTANAIEKLTAKAPNMNKNEVIEHIINLINIYNLDVNNLISAAKAAKFAKDNCPNEYSRVHKACCSCSYANECKDNEVDKSKNKNEEFKENKIKNVTYICYGQYDKDNKACKCCYIKTGCINKSINVEKDKDKIDCYGNCQPLNAICRVCDNYEDCINKTIDSKF